MGNRLIRACSGNGKKRNIMPTRRNILSAMLLWNGLIATMVLAGCGQTATPVTPPSANQVNSYFGNPFTVAGSVLPPNNISKIDHAANQIGMTGFVTTPAGQVPAGVLSGTFTTAPTGFLSITENFATPTTGVITAQNPPLAGAWAVEIPGSGALSNLLTLNNTGAGLPVTAAPAAMAANLACPNFPQPAPYLYVTVPNSAITNDTADFGLVNITTQGSAVTFNAQPYFVGGLPILASTVTGGCSDTTYGPLTAYPLNAFKQAPNLELIAISQPGLLMSSFSSNGSSTPGAFGGGTGVIGVDMPTAPVDIGTVISGQYNGFLFAPNDTLQTGYDNTVLAAAFGDNTGTSSACSALQSSLIANSGQGVHSVAALPSPNSSIYGGEFLNVSGATPVNDPTGAIGSENCDVVIDLGTQHAVDNGLFPSATIYIGSNYPPFSTSKPWKCFGTTSTCSVSFPATAVVGKVQGQFVIFVVASTVSTPAAMLPDMLGNRIAQPMGIYLFQKKQ